MLDLKPRLRREDIVDLEADVASGVVRQSEQLRDSGALNRVPLQTSSQRLRQHRRRTYLRELYLVVRIYNSLKLSPRVGDVSKRCLAVHQVVQDTSQRPNI